MKFIKNNILSITAMVFLFTLVMIDPAAAENLGSGSVFTSAKSKLNQLFQNAKLVVFVIGGFGLAVVAAAGAIVDYATSTEGNTPYTDFSDSLE